MVSSLRFGEYLLEIVGELHRLPVHVHVRVQADALEDAGGVGLHERGGVLVERIVQCAVRFAVERKRELHVLLFGADGLQAHADPGVGEVLQGVLRELHFDAGSGVRQGFVKVALDHAVLAGGGEEERVLEVDVVDLRFAERIGLLHEHDRDGAVDGAAAVDLAEPDLREEDRHLQAVAVEHGLGDLLAGPVRDAAEPDVAVAPVEAGVFDLPGVRCLHAERGEARPGLDPVVLDGFEGKRLAGRGFEDGYFRHLESEADAAHLEFLLGDEKIGVGDAELRVSGGGLRQDFVHGLGGELARAGDLLELRQELGEVLREVGLLFRDGQAAFDLDSGASAERDVRVDPPVDGEKFRVRFQAERLRGVVPLDRAVERGRLNTSELELAERDLA